jgi:hypothetical protein
MDDSERIGIQGASLAGGAEIMIDGQGMTDSPTDFNIVFTNNKLKISAAGPPLSCKNPFHISKIEFLSLISI